MRATKITKYFECENKNPLNFFPTKQKKEESNNTHMNRDNNIDYSPKPKASSVNIPSSSFDTINIQLDTKYYTCGYTIEYFIYFNNNSQMDIKGSITNVDSEICGDLMALHETLKYIVYHPNMSQKLNRYKFNIYTNSKIIYSIFSLSSPKRQTMSNNEIVVKSKSNVLDNNLYFKIQSLLKCIKNISIEYWNTD